MSYAFKNNSIQSYYNITFLIHGDYDLLNCKIFALTIV